MDKTVLRNFAIESRKDLMEKIDRKIKLFYVDEEFKKDNRGDVIVLSNDKHTLTLTREEDINRDKLIKRIVELGYDQVVEEAAYTWFNRLIAIRYMELHNFLPLTNDNQSLDIRVLSSKENEPIPEILKFTNLNRNDLDINFDKNVFQSFSLEDDKFKYILLLICKKLGNVIPQVFDGITDYIDLLIPDNMLKENGFISKLLNEIDVENFSEVEIIGWLYQYYNQTEKDRVMSDNKAYSQNEIPYATQIFTPDWIVKYMVENSLGRYYLENINYDYSLINNWHYFIKCNFDNCQNNISIENLKFIDPCCGSGHILVYAFEILYQFYLNSGYTSSVIPELILKNNLFGVDIDDRAGQLSILSVLLKAREFDKNIFNKNLERIINIMSIPESSFISPNIIDYLKDEKAKSVANSLLNCFHNAKDIGSLIRFNEAIDVNVLSEEIKMDNTLFKYELSEKLIPLIKAYKILSDKYNVVVTNPPYMGHNKMNSIIKSYLTKYYKNGKSDLCTAFMEYNNVVKDGYLAMINQQAWMSLESFEDLRNEILNNKYISSMIHLGFGTFGADFGTTSFVLKNNSNFDKGFYFSTRDVRTSEEKEEKYLNCLKNNDYYLISQSVFKKIPGNIISYWLTQNQFDIFEKNELFGKYGETKKGVLSGNDKRFLRLWFEVDNNKIGYNLKNHDDMVEKNYKWIPVTSGGNYRKWYGNFENVINLENDGFEIKNNKDNSCRLRENKYYFKESITWSEVSMKGFSVRYVPNGILFGNSGPVCFLDKDLYYFLGFLNSKISTSFLKLLSPTLTFGPEQIKRIPAIVNDASKDVISDLVRENISIMKEDWDSNETSWEFKKNPLLEEKIKEEKIEDSINKYNDSLREKFKLLVDNETRINKEFIDIYNLSSELNADINLNEITIKQPDIIRDIKMLISYSVGCMFGRYSLDNDGLIFAGGDFNISDYIKYKPDNDNIIPISDDSNVYYNDDLVGKFIDFIKVSFGDKYFNQNIDYIAEVLGKKGTESSEDTIRRYFVNDFFSDHVKTYQKRPIYWLFDSGKKNGFKCLVYLHRYDEQIVSKIRTKYLHNTLSIYLRTVEEIDYKLNNEKLSTTDKRELQNKKVDINNKITECNEYEEMVGNVANKMIKLDLDDGVAVNYAKFVDDNGKSILAKIK